MRAAHITTICGSRIITKRYEVANLERFATSVLGDAIR
jgi:hypothetical protein